MFVCVRVSVCAMPCIDVRDMGWGYCRKPKTRDRRTFSRLSFILQRGPSARHSTVPWFSLGQIKWRKRNIISLTITLC